MQPSFDSNRIYEFQRNYRLTQASMSKILGKGPTYIANLVYEQRYTPELLDLLDNPAKYLDGVKKAEPKQAHINPDLARFPVGTKIVHKSEGIFKGIVRGYKDGKIAASKPLEFRATLYEPSLFRPATPKDECYHVQDHLISWRDLK